MSDKTIKQKLRHGVHFSAKVIVVGDVAVGKTSLIRQFTNQMITREYYMTIGVDYLIKEIEIPNNEKTGKNKTLRFQLWDTAGQERFRSITSAYYKDATCAILVFSLADPTSFQKIVDVWYPDIIRTCSPHTHIVLVGTKSDLCKYPNRTFDRRVRDWAKENEIPFYETNMSDTFAVHDIFYETGKKIFNIVSTGVELPGFRCLDVDIDTILLHQSRILSDDTESQKKWYELWRWCF